MTAQTVLGSWPAEAATVPAARRAVRDWLRSNGRPEHLDAAELVVSELVSNVVLHVGGDVRVSIARSGEDLLLEVHDSSSVLPHTRMFSQTSSTGRGMRLVHSLSAAHGVHLSESGKTVWVRLTTDAVRRSEDELTAQFAQVDWLQQVDRADGDQGEVVALRREPPCALLRAAA